MLKDKHGLVIGAMKNTKYHDYTIDLSPGDALFVISDGVTEAVNAAHEFFGTDRLGESLNDCADGSPKEVLQSVRAHVSAFVGDAEQFDDMTMVCLEYLGRTDDAASSGSTCKELTVSAVIESVSAVEEFVSRELEAIGCRGSARTQLMIAIDEIVSNVAKFAYDGEVGEITVRLSIMNDDSIVELAFIDRGRSFNPLDEDDPDVTLEARLREKGGLGIFMVKKIMDEIFYDHRDGMNILTIREHLKK